MLLAASYFFYMCWRPEYIVLIILSTLIDYYAGIHIEQATTQAKKKKYLYLSLATNLGLLFTFKYFNFFNNTFTNIFQHFQIPYPIPALNVLLPIGISFYTFQTLSYTLDVYFGKRKAEKHLGIFALYVSFFPQLVAGPIERSVHFLPQLRKKFNFDYARVTDGLKLMLWGLFKKVVIADRLSIFVDMIYSQPTEWKGIPILLATYYFAFQIYCDFSGYTDIARGAAKVMGFNLMLNFRQPYLAQSISEFWKRWHISLSTWFRDYLYIPLGGNRVGRRRWYYNIIIVFVLSGLWHGAEWTFVIWGGLHALYMLLEIGIKPIQNTIKKHFPFDSDGPLLTIGRIVITFHLVLFAWIFFRAQSFSDATILIQNLFQKSQKAITYDFNLWINSILIYCLFCVQIVQNKTGQANIIKHWPKPARWAIYYLLLLGIIFLGKFDSIEFIYFQF